MKKSKKVGLLTGGGDCPGLNAVIRAVSKTLMNDHGYEVIGFEDGYDGCIRGRYHTLAYGDVSGILTQGGTILGTSNKSNPFAVPVETGGTVKMADKSNDCIRFFKKLGIECLVCIGGDGTLSIAQRFVEKGLPCIGVPKTIDNDLSCTDVTFGFDSAVAVATKAIDMLHSTAMSHHRVMLVEVMGRYAGWIALVAGIAGGGDVILIPELPYKLEEVCTCITKRYQEGKRFSLVIVSEGAKPYGGKMVVKQTIADSPDPIRLGGIAQKLAVDIESATRLETRATILGHLQRGGSPTAYDRVLATRFGAKAAELVVKKQYGKMVALRGSTIAAVSMKAAVRSLKKVKPGSELIRIARSVGTSFGV